MNLWFSSPLIRFCPFCVRLKEQQQQNKTNKTKNTDKKTTLEAHMINSPMKLSTKPAYRETMKSNRTGCTHVSCVHNLSDVCDCDGENQKVL